MALINTLVSLKINWASGGSHIIVQNTDGGSGGVYTLDADLICTGALILTATEAVILTGGDSYNFRIDSVNFTISGVNTGSKITFKEGDNNTMMVLATSGGVTGVFNYCAFNESSLAEGLAIAGAMAGNIEITCNNCSGDSCAEDVFGILNSAVGIGFTCTLTCNDCVTTNCTASDIADGFTAHARNQILNINNCTVDNCTNGVRVIESAGTENPLEVNISGLTCTNCVRAFEGMHTDVYNVVIDGIDYNSPASESTLSSVIRCGGGTASIKNIKILGSNNVRYGISLGSAITSASIENAIVTGFNFVDGSGVGVGLFIEGSNITVKNIVLHNNNLLIYTLAGSSFQINNSILSGATNADGAFLNTLGAWYSGGGDEYKDNASSGNNFFYDNDLNFGNVGNILKGTDLSTDPGLVNPGSGDFTITDASNAYEAGDSATASTTDILGITRSDPPDIGAYEYIIPIPDPDPDPDPETVTDVSSDLFLTSPTVASTGTFINSDGTVENYSSTSIQKEIIQDGNNFTNKSILNFRGETTIILSTIYPLRTYSTVTTSVRNKTFVGEPAFSSRATSSATNRAEIRYTVNGKKPSLSSKVYKKALVFKQNTAGSDDIILKYRVYYKGNKSEVTTIEFRINKINSSDNYEFGPLQD